MSPAEAHLALGAMLRERGDLSAAEANFRQATALRPDDLDAHAKLAEVLWRQGKRRDAIPVLQRLAHLDPARPQWYGNLGQALCGEGRLQEAEAVTRQAVALNPNLAEAHLNLGWLAAMQGKPIEAVESYRRALDLKPSLAAAHNNLAYALLQLGEFTQGWAELEWRWEWPEYPWKRPAFSQPPWRGEALHGRTIAVYSEMGFGDVIQFVRYVPLVAARGGQVVLHCYPELQRLLRGLEGVWQTVTGWQGWPPIDTHVPVLSLPHLFGTTLATIPASVSYLHADPGLVAAWAPRLPTNVALRVGLVWAGAPRQDVDCFRSLPLAALAPLGQAPHAAFVGLQKGRGAAQVAHPPAGMRFCNLGPQLGDFADTAAVVSQLDLVISVDTAVAHLAGALGKPVWILLPYSADWRWLLDRDDSPWYPTARLFRQRRPGDWAEVVTRVAKALGKFAPGRAARERS